MEAPSNHRTSRRGGGVGGGTDARVMSVGNYDLYALVYCIAIQVLVLRNRNADSGWISYFRRGIFPSSG